MPTLKKRQMQGPASGAGLMRYFDVEEGGPKLDPKMVLGFVVAIIILELLSHIIL